MRETITAHTSSVENIHRIGPYFCATLTQLFKQKPTGGFIEKAFKILVSLFLILAEFNVYPSVIVGRVEEGSKIHLKLLSEMHRYSVGIGDFTRWNLAVVIVVSGSVICDSHMYPSE